MPARNTIKIDVAESYYHIYARGTNKQPIFLDEADYYYFQKLLSRYLSVRPAHNKAGMQYPHYADQIELLAFCLMGNHFHLLVYQKDAGIMASFMRSLMTSYSKYFNLKYNRTGSLFESRYKAARVDKQDYLQHISRYIHLNPRYWKRYPYSSLQYYQKGKEVEWLKPQKIRVLFAGFVEYMTFLEDYGEHKKMLQEFKKELADQ